MGVQTTRVVVDWPTFDPWHIQTVRHTLSDHPLLQIDELVELGKRMERAGRTLSFSSEAGADANFNTVAHTHPNQRSAVETIQWIREARAWMLLRHVQTDPIYRTLVDEILDGIKPEIERKDPGMCYRAGWIFVSSPHAVTPFHIDRNQVLLLQLFGTKTVYVWDADDDRVVSERARARFLACHSLDLVQWDEAFRARAHVIRLEAGMGVYMPLTSPHMVEIGDDPSVAISLSYNTDASRRKVLLHVLHDRMHGLHVELPPVGRHALFDSASLAGAHAAIRVRRLGRRLAGRPTAAASDGVPYAIAD